MYPQYPSHGVCQANEARDVHAVKAKKADDSQEHSAKITSSTDPRHLAPFIGESPKEKPHPMDTAASNPNETEKQRNANPLFGGFNEKNSSEWQGKDPRQEGKAFAEDERSGSQKNASEAPKKQITFQVGAKAGIFKGKANKRPLSDPRYSQSTRADENKKFKNDDSKAKTISKKAAVSIQQKPKVIIETKKPKDDQQKIVIETRNQITNEEEQTNENEGKQKVIKFDSSSPKVITVKPNTTTTTTTTQQTTIKIEKPAIKLTIPPRVMTPDKVKETKILPTILPPNKESKMNFPITINISKALPKITKVVPNKRSSSNPNQAPPSLYVSCPSCQFICTEKKHLYQHFLDKHRLVSNFENTFIQSQSKKAGTIICIVCHDEIPANDFVEHCTSLHQNEMVKFFAECPNPPLSKYAQKIIDEEVEKENRENEIKNAEIQLITNKKNEEDSKPEEEQIHEQEMQSNEYSSTDDDLSSVSDSDMSDDSNENDEALNQYLAFITSTIDMNGLAAPGKKETQKRDEPKAMEIQPQKSPNETKQAIPPETNITDKIENYLSSLSMVEQFLLQNKMIQIIPQPNCHICSKDFSSCVMLMKHCHDVHRPRFTPTLLKALDFIVPGITLTHSDDELLLQPELKLYLTLYPPLKVPDHPRVLQEVALPHFISSMIIEALSVDRPQTEMLIYPKSFSNEVVMIRLPIPLPIVVRTEEECTVFGFVNTPHCSASEACEMFTKIAEREANTMIITMKITDVAPFAFPKEAFLEIVEKYGLMIMHTAPQVNDGLVSMEIYSFCSVWTSDLEETIKNELVSLYYEAEMSKCPKCGGIYLVPNPGKCSDENEHEIGDQVSFAEFYNCSLGEM